MEDINSKKIKDLELKTSLADSDDFVVEDTTPTTKRVKWSTMLKAISNELVLTDEDITEIMGAATAAAEQEES